MQSHFPLAVSSTTDGTHATNSYHYRGEAVDLVASSPVMYSAAAWVISSGLYRTLLEGIHNPNLSVQNGAQVSPAVWGAATWAEHVNHIHLAASTLSGFSGAGAPTPVTVSTGAQPTGPVDLSPIQDAILGSSMYAVMGPEVDKAATRAHHAYTVSHDTWYRIRGLSTFDKKGGH